MSRVFQYKKAVQSLNYFSINLDKKQYSTKLYLLKYIYLADRYHVRKYGRFITNDAYFAMKYGPVASSVKDIIEGDGDDSDEKKYFNKYLKSKDLKVSSICDVDLKVFSDTDIEALNFVRDNFLNNKKIDIIDHSHEYPEWKKWENELNSGASRAQMSPLDFFNDPENKNIFFTDNKLILDSSKEVFISELKNEEFLIL